MEPNDQLNSISQPSLGPSAENKPLITVAIPMYNALPYLDKCLGSISSQTYRNFDVLILNDGSTDGSPAVARRWAEGARRAGINARVIDQENHGLLMARRMLLDAAKGTYVTFLDSDDELRGDALERVASAIGRTNADIIAFSYSRSREYKRDATKDTLPEGYYHDESYQRIREEAVSGKFNNICGKAFRVSQLDAGADYSDYEGLMQGEDWLQLMGAINGADSLVRLRDILYYYRQSDTQSMATYRKSQLDDLMRVSKVVLDRASEWGGDCPAIAREGVLRQAALITNLMLRSGMGRDDKKLEYMRISRCLWNVMDRREANRLISKLRLDQALTTAALAKDSFGFARLVAMAVSVGKRVLRR